MNVSRPLKLIILISTAFPSGIGIILSDIPINSSKITLILTIFAVFSIIYTRKQFSFQAMHIDKYVLFFGLTLIVCSISAGINNKASISAGTSLAINAIIWFFSYFSIYFLSRTISNSLKQIEEIEQYIINILLVCAIIGIIEYIFKINFYGKIADVIGLKDTGGVTGVLLRGDQVRARSSFDQSIALGFAMILGIFLVEKKSNNNNCFAYLKIFIFFMAMLFSFSRSSIAIFGFYVAYRNYVLGGLKSKALVIAASLIVTLLFMSRIDEIFYLDDSMDSGDGNLLVRFRDFEFIGYCLEQFPLFGIGSGLLHNSQALDQSYPELFTFYDGALDNMFLGVLVEFGLIGFMSYILFLYSILKIKRFTPSKTQKCLMTGLFFVGVGASLSYDVFVFPGVGRLFLIIIGLNVSEIIIHQQSFKNDR